MIPESLNKFNPTVVFNENQELTGVTFRGVFYVIGISNKGTADFSEKFSEDGRIILHVRADDVSECVFRTSDTIENLLGRTERDYQQYSRFTGYCYAQNTRKEKQERQKETEERIRKYKEKTGGIIIRPGNQYDRDEILRLIQEDNTQLINNQPPDWEYIRNFIHKGHIRVAVREGTQQLDAVFIGEHIVGRGFIIHYLSVDKGRRGNFKTVKFISSLLEELEDNNVDFIIAYCSKRISTILHKKAGFIVGSECFGVFKRANNG